jgi:ubiquinone biosynthesis protein
MREITQVAVKHGFGYFFERHRLQTLLPLRRRKRVALPSQRGRHLREMLEELGPTFVKFGQLLSTRPDIVPKDMLEELVKLQDRVSALPYSVVAEVVERELGMTVERAFAAFEAEPLASASIGQVHGAVLPGGKRVVVKVQRPEAPRIVRRDIDLLFQLAELMEHRIDPGFSPTAVVQEFSRSMSRELDYALEARNAIRFAKNLGDLEGSGGWLCARRPAPGQHRVSGAWQVWATRFRDDRFFALERPRGRHQTVSVGHALRSSRDQALLGAAWGEVESVR